LQAYLERRLDYPALACKTCWTHHLEDGAPYPCPECPEQLALDPADGLALDVWRLLAGLQRPAIADLAREIVRGQLADLTPGEWLGLLDRLALMDRMIPLPESQSGAMLATLLSGRR
jgi:hypothetical protein